MIIYTPASGAMSAWEKSAAGASPARMLIENFDGAALPATWTLTHLNASGTVEQNDLLFTTGMDGAHYTIRTGTVGVGDHSVLHTSGKMSWNVYNPQSRLRMRFYFSFNGDGERWILGFSRNPAASGLAADLMSHPYGFLYIHEAQSTVKTDFAGSAAESTNIATPASVTMHVLEILIDRVALTVAYTLNGAALGTHAMPAYTAQTYGIVPVIAGARVAATKALAIQRVEVVPE